MTITEVLDAVLTAIPVEAEHVMRPDDGSEPNIYTDFRHSVPTLTLQPLERFAFYETTKRADVGLIIVTGDFSSVGEYSDHHCVVNPE